MLSLALIVVALADAQGCATSTVIDRAHALVRRHRDEDAVALLREALRTHPEDVPARRLLIRLLGLRGDLPGARTEVAALARSVPPDDPSPQLELGHGLELAHRYDEALEAYDEAARLAPASPEGPREGGMRCAHWGEPEQARERLEEAVRRGAHDAETWHALGLVRLNLGDLDGAEAAYRAGAALPAPRAGISPGSSDAAAAENWLGLATIAVVRGDAVRALVAYDEVLARRPRFAAGALGRAWALAKLGRPDDASRALDQAADLGAPPANVARQRAALSSSVPH